MAIVPEQRTPRRRGLRVDGDALETLMTERALQADELAKLARVSEDTISRLRRGGRIERSTLLRIVDALDRAPRHPLLGRLAPAGPDKRDLTVGQTVRSKEAGNGSAELRRQA